MTSVLVHTGSLIKWQMPFWPWPQGWTRQRQNAILVYNKKVYPYKMNKIKKSTEKVEKLERSLQQYSIMALKTYIKYVQCFRSCVTGHTLGWLELPNPTRFRWTVESRPAKGSWRRPSASVCLTSWSDKRARHLDIIFCIIIFRARVMGVFLEDFRKQKIL